MTSTNEEDCSLKIWNLKEHAIIKIQTIIIQDITNAIYQRVYSSSKMKKSRKSLMRRSTRFESSISKMGLLRVMKMQKLLTRFIHY